MRDMMQKLKLTVNEDEDAAVPAAGRERSTSWATRSDGCYSPRTGEPYLGMRPSQKKRLRLCREISEMTTPTSGCCWTPEEHGQRDSTACWLAGRTTSAWARSARPTEAWTTTSASRLRQWWCAKHKVRNRGTSRFPDELSDEQLGLIRSGLGRAASRGRTRDPCPRAGCGKSARPVR